MTKKPETAAAAAIPVPPRDGPPEEVQIATLLARIGGLHTSAVATVLAPLDLRPKQFGVMNMVALADGPSQGEISAAMGIDPSGLIATIDELEQRGWLERRRDPGDRRRNIVALTPAGRTKLTEGREVARRRAQELTAPLSAKERRQLRDLLAKIA
ncbi:MAG: winged helix-turn-helix transcriptional regulator [Actinobacteria bacterium]|nr:winged helix-turn-helix transcriptional regulator [Actinomycetota bacterium]